MSDLNPYEAGLAYDLGRAQARIKELEKAERQTYRDALELAKQIETLTKERDAFEAKLAKAVEVLEKLNVGEGWAAQIARTTLAELTGGKDE